MGQQTLFEKIGVQYEERDGLFYPLITLDIKDDGVNVGKYGHMWMQYLKNIHSGIGVCYDSGN